jgi:hypothetical protein
MQFCTATLRSASFALLGVFVLLGSHQGVYARNLIELSRLIAADTVCDPWPIWDCYHNPGCQRIPNPGSPCEFEITFLLEYNEVTCINCIAFVAP